MEIVIAILGSGLLASLVSGIINLIGKAQDRKYKKEDSADATTEELKSIKKSLHKNEVDVVRLQLMVLMSDYQQDQAELMRCAEHYFRDLHGNWFMTGLFNNYLKQNNIAEPNWFEKEE